ncbi:MAG: PEP-CTERM sorting domain-containing protein [Planctomycetes bacterium]|nr:PEP-CTERM sorting domain-containing protein [Planctomycetota bacterium]
MPQKTAIRAAVALVLIVAAFSVRSVARGGLLDEHFGVTLELDAGQYDRYQKTTTYPFELSSFTPSNNVDTVDYIVGDWYGHWSKDKFRDKTIRGAYPSSAEPYDVEALYFDDDPINLYVVVVTSFPGPPGLYEKRLSGSPLLVTGDLAIDLGLNTARSMDNFSYDYGVNINYERRRSSGDARSGGSTAGDEVYRTQNSDWYVGSPRYATAASGELTNFDPDYAGFAGVYAGDADVDIYEYAFEGGRLEGGHPTYVIEMTIPRGALIELYEEDEVGIGWVEGCRNDGNGHRRVLRFEDLPDIDCNRTPSGSPVPEPTTATLLGLGAALALFRRRRG